MNTKPKIDSIYTPTAIARVMVDAANISLGEEGFVADFAAGRGELLAAAQGRWPSARITGTDIDASETRFLKRKYSGWQVGRCDFLNPKSRNNSAILRGLIGRTSLVILNPPFSCRGGKRVAASTSGHLVKCSVGMAFVVNSVDYLMARGTLVAILPSGCLSSERDSEAWTILRKLGTVKTIKHNGHNTFPKATVDTEVVRFVKGDTTDRQVEVITKRKSDDNKSRKADIQVVRGNLQMNEVETELGNKGVTLIHSTDLKGGNLSIGRIVSNKTARVVAGPIVLIPRVGRPNREKVVCYTGDETFALSDCVLALLCPSKEKASEVMKSIIQNWSLLERSYSGSGAKYTTVKRIIDVLSGLGYCARSQKKVQGKIAMLVP